MLVETISQASKLFVPSESAHLVLGDHCAINGQIPSPVIIWKLHRRTHNGKKRNGQEVREEKLLWEEEGV